MEQLTHEQQIAAGTVIAFFVLLGGFILFAIIHILTFKKPNK